MLQLHLVLVLAALAHIDNAAALANGMHDQLVARRQGEDGVLRGSKGDIVVKDGVVAVGVNLPIINDRIRHIAVRTYHQRQLDVGDGQGSRRLHRVVVRGDVVMAAVFDGEHIVVGTVIGADRSSLGLIGKPLDRVPRQKCRRIENGVFLFKTIVCHGSIRGTDGKMTLRYRQSSYIARDNVVCIFIIVSITRNNDVVFHRFRCGDGSVVGHCHAIGIGETVTADGHSRAGQRRAVILLRRTRSGEGHLTLVHCQGTVLQGNFGIIGSMAFTIVA